MATTLQWDLDGTRYYKTGVSKGVLWVYDALTKTYGDGVVFDGLTKVSEAPEGGEVTTSYADNIDYLNRISMEKFGGTISAFYYPDEFALCDGSATIGAARITQQRRAKFGFSWVTKKGENDAGDDYGEQIHIVWNALCSPSSQDSETINDSPSQVEFSWTFKCASIPVETELGNFTPMAHMVITVDGSTPDTELAGINRVKAKLYGDGTTPSTLLTPGEILDLLAEGPTPPETPEQTVSPLRSKVAENGSSERVTK